jgi:hypothetical protein
MSEELLMTSTPQRACISNYRVKLEFLMKTERIEELNQKVGKSKFEFEKFY